MPRLLRFKRLSTQIYLTIVLCLLALVIAAGAMWRRASDPLPVRQAFEVAGELVAGTLPPASADAESVKRTLGHFADKLKLDLALFDAQRRPLAFTGRPLPSPPENTDEGGFVFGRGGPAWAIALPDGRWLVARNPRRGIVHPALRFVGFLGVIAAVIGLTAFPLARGLTRRLERLQSGVDRLGAGDLAARVDVHGSDEVARLAESFNKSATRIETLVKSQRMLLANASHELRTPLTRLRVALELTGENMPEAQRKAIARDIGELDDMVDEILLLSRIGADVDLAKPEPVDLLALAAEEAAHYDNCTVTGTAELLQGDTRLLRRLIRNLLENSERYGKPPVTIGVVRRGDEIRLSVTDDGAGFDSKEIGRAFEPFQRGAGRGNSPGSGLGLALVRSIAARHGGSVEIVSGDDGVRLNRVDVRLPVRV